MVDNMEPNVIIWPGITTLDRNPEQVLQAALDKGLDQVVIIGFDKEGGEFFASSQADGGDVLWHLQRAIHNLMKITDDLDRGDI
jgi:hypothetical protein